MRNHHQARQEDQRQFHSVTKSTKFLAEFHCFKHANQLLFMNVLPELKRFACYRASKINMNTLDCIMKRFLYTYTLPVLMLFLMSVQYLESD